MRSALVTATLCGLVALSAAAPYPQAEDATENAESGGDDELIDPDNEEQMAESLGCVLDSEAHDDEGCTYIDGEILPPDANSVTKWCVNLDLNDPEEVHDFWEGERGIGKWLDYYSKKDGTYDGWFDRLAQETVPAGTGNMNIAVSGTRDLAQEVLPRDTRH